MAKTKRMTLKQAAELLNAIDPLYGKKFFSLFFTLWSYKSHKNFHDMVSGLLIFMVFTGIWWLIFGLIDINLVNGYWTNVITTIGGTVLTIFVLDKWNGNRATKQRKEELILQMGNQAEGGFAIEACRLLKINGWLEDGSLRNADLRNANLKNAHLLHANLQDTLLKGANLQDTNLWYANLKNCILQNANLQNANLAETNLRTVDLRNANLESANLWHANLEGADLRGANLPDGSHWASERDLREFTHPEEWQAEQAVNQVSDADILQPSLSIEPEPPPLTFEYISRPQRPRWLDMR